MINLDKIKAGDAAETDKMVERFTPQIVILSYRLARNNAGIREDLVQAGLLALVQAARGYDAAKGAAFATFALLCAKRRMIDEWRRLTRNDGLTVGLDDAENIYTDADLDIGMMKRDLLAALPNILSAAELKVFLMKMRGASYAEIARALSNDKKTTTEKAVDNALKRARKKIYELYNAI
ncbi:hypothetical protein FACS1894211_00040 [Clostridia bacterium]|nr:hypothetical protein FACS1894211_00040 [Clostridia bacterium]